MSFWPLYTFALLCPSVFPLCSEKRSVHGSETGMYLLLWLISFSLLRSWCVAFYPYHRSDPTEPLKDNTKKISTRNVVAAHEAHSDSIKIPIRRHAFGRSGSKLTGSPVKRDNHYTIVTASQPSQTNSLAVDQDGTDFSYFSAVDFGSTGKTMYLLIDSGASTTWVMGSDCKTQACQSHNVFGNADSSTLESTDKSFSLAYGTGSVLGSAASDNVDFGSFVVNISFGLASDASDDFLDYPMDGILGLGRPSSDEGRYPTVFEAIMAARSLKSNQFGVHLSSTADGETNGELNFGAPDTSRYDGTFSYTKTVSNGPMWDIPIDDAGFNGDLCGFKGRTGIIDTGTSFLLLPPDDAENLHSKIPGFHRNGETFSVPCSTTQPVQLIFSGIRYNVSSTDYVLKSEADSEMCPSNIIGKKPFDDNQWLIGDVFLKNVYTVFDFDKNQVGFGVKDAASSSPSPISTTMSASKTSITASGSKTVTSTSGSTSPAFLLPEGDSATPAAVATTGGAPSAATPSSIASCPKLQPLLSVGVMFASVVCNFLF